MRLNLAQWTGLCVTVIVVAGSDMDVLYAVPMGMLAGALATFLSAIAHGALEKVATERATTRPPG
jgi:hypothetical protein